MADERIEDITGGELAAVAPDDKFVILDKSDTTDDADGTVKYVEAATMGLWEYATGTDAATAMAVGTWYNVNMSGWTADRVYSLPSTAAVGDRIAVCITSGDDAYEMDLQTTAASNDTINGVDHDSTPWSRLFITGEVVIFKCVTANTAWIVEYDGRIPQQAMLRKTDAQTIADNTLDPIEHNTQVFDIGDIAIVSSGAGVSGKITMRRPCKIIAQHGVGIVGSTTAWVATDRISTRLYLNGSDTHVVQAYVAAAGSGTELRRASYIADAVAGDYFEHYILQNPGGTNPIQTAAANDSYFGITEIL